MEVCIDKGTFGNQIDGGGSAAPPFADQILGGDDSEFEVVAEKNLGLPNQMRQLKGKAKMDDSEMRQLKGKAKLDDSPNTNADHDGSYRNYGTTYDDPKKQIYEREMGCVLYNRRVRAWMMVTNAEKAWYLRRTGRGINIICPQHPVVDKGGDGTQSTKEDTKKMKTEEAELPFLSEEIVEKIFKHVAFPNILNICSLNKCWQAKFTPSPEHATFQEEVNLLSSTWKSYCPVILNMENESMMGFDREQNRWLRMKLGFQTQSIGQWFTFQMYRGAGSLLCGLWDRSDIFILNLVTREQKWLPQRPTLLQVRELHLIPMGKDAYQVLVLSKQRMDIWCQVYDSRTGSWKLTHSRLNTAFSNSTSTYLNGNLYSMEYDLDDRNNVMKIVLYNVQKGLWSMIPHPFKHMLHEIECYELLCCRSQVMIVLRLHPIWWFTDPSRKTFRNTLMIFRLDPLTSDIREVCRGPPDNVDSPSTLFTCDDNSFYFGDPQTPGSFIIEYSLDSRQWTCLPPPKGMDGSFKNKWCTFTFQPGMNPFVRV